MPTIKIERIVSFSSEDEKHRAENILNADPNKVWKCKEPGAKTAVVVLQLTEPSVIDKIYIANAHSAFIEVLVGRSTCSDDFETLLAMSSFMTPLDSRNSVNSTRMRTFERDQLQTSSRERWDRVKIVCTQPFNRHVCYGLTFVDLITFKNDPARPTRVLDRLILRPSSPNDLLSPSLPSQTKPEPLSSKKDIEMESKTNENIEMMKNRKNARTPMKVEHMRKNNRDKRSGDSLLDDEVKESKQPSTHKRKHEENEPSQTVSSSSPAPTTSKPRVEATHSNGVKKMKVLKPKVRTKPFNQLMNDVVFAMSGYVNPERANLRSMALKMGAQYKPDWMPSCTHLICAFRNTPKYNQVRGHGKIVKSQWIEDCHNERKRIPWRRYALDPREAAESDSESEIVDEANVPEADGAKDENCVKTRKKLCISSGSDTEDEIEKVLARGNVKVDLKGESPANLNVASSFSKSLETERKIVDVYSADTDVDDDGDSGIVHENGSHDLPDFFNGLQFYLDKENWSRGKVDQVVRYITAYKGSITDDKKDATHVISDGNDEFESRSSCKVVSSKWIYDCNDASKLLPY